MNDPTLTAIILNWNGRRFLDDLLRSLEAQSRPAEQVILVDNASTDDSVAFVRDQYPAVNVLPLAENRGFSAGNNVALRRVTTDVAVLLNPDVVLDPDCLAALRRPFAADPAIGIAGAKLLEPDGETIQHAGGIINYPQALAGYHGLGEVDAGQWQTRRDVDYVVGAALASRRAVWEQVGLLDEGYFLYFEDADFCARARAAGWRVVVEPAAQLVHRESSLTRRGSPLYLRHYHHGRWRYLLRHAPLATVLAETAPAEETWLARRPLLERRAAARAYHAAWAQWPAIAAARGADAAAVTAIGDLLRRLIIAAWPAPRHDPPAAPGLARLQEASRVVERPFVSPLPLVGPAIAWLRGLWFRVADRSYLRPQLADQNVLNALVVERLAALEADLAVEAAALAAIEATLLEYLTTPPADPGAITELHRETTAAQRRLQVLSPDAGPGGSPPDANQGGTN